MSSPNSPKESGLRDTVDIDDPLYLHPSDSAIVSIVSIKLTGTDNFRVWKSSMIRALKGRNKLCFVDGSYSIPNEKDEKIYKKWERVNAVVCSWILGSISESIYSNHVCSEIAHEIWKELLETYQKSDGSVIFNVHQRINGLTQNGLTVSEFFPKLDALWKEFDALTSLTECTCEANTSLKNHSKLMKLMQFLNGLDDGYSQVKSHILLMEPLPSVRTAFSVVSREESLQKGGSLTSNSNKVGSQPTAFVSKFSDSKRFNKGKNFNTGNNSYTFNSLQCKHCGAKGHTIERCFKIIGYPKDFKFRSSNEFQNKSDPQGSGRSFANNAYVSNVSDDSDVSKAPDSDKFFLTGEQYAKFLTLINGNSGMEGVTANMAGFSIQGDCGDW